MDEQDIYTEFGLEHYEDDDIMTAGEVCFMQGYLGAINS